MVFTTMVEKQGGIMHSPVAHELAVDSSPTTSASIRSKCSFEYRSDGNLEIYSGGSSSSGAADSSFKRRHYTSDLEHRTCKRSCTTPTPKAKESPGSTCAESEFKEPLLYVWSKRIVDDLRVAPSVEDACARLQVYLSDFGLDKMNQTSNDENEAVEALKSKVTQLLNERQFLCNVIKSQYETITKLQQGQIVAESSVHERDALKMELKKLKETIAKFLAKNANALDLAPENFCNFDDDNGNDNNNFREPPNVY